METDTRLEDLIGLEYTKLGFFKEVQIKISELRASNLEVERKRLEIQAILDGITDVMAVVSLEFQIVSVNHVFFDFFEHRSPTGHFCYEVFRKQDRPCSPCPLVTAREENRVCRQMFICHLKGKNRQFEITASPLRDFRGKPFNILILKRDVTLEKEYQAKYYQAEKMATIGVLAAGVAHEVNNPLTAVSGFAEGLRRRLPRLKEKLGQTPSDRELWEDFQEYVETILTECNRCRDIVQSLLTFSPRKYSEFSPVNLNALIREVLKLLRYQLKNHPPERIVLELDQNIPDVRGIAAELKQVVLNLILNALDAIREKGNIVIRTYKSDKRWIVLSVKDSGCGISPEHLNKLFEPFFTTKPVGKGTGIGLSTCYNIIRQHEGEIVVSSEQGKGSVFDVRLPEAKSEK
jgi:two-component system, NtrC family, sensor kinase